MRKNEDGLVAFFDADKTSERIGADVEKKIQAIRGDAAIKIAAAELEQATALRTIKDCGETVASIAEATELSAAEVRKLLKLAPASSARRRDTNRPPRSLTPRTYRRRHWRVDGWGREASRAVMALPQVPTATHAVRSRGSVLSAR